jgi:hypothetical protein
MTDIIAAMSAAVQELIAKTEEELDIASPSGVFYDIGQNIARGLEQGIADSLDLEEVLLGRMRRLSMSTPISAYDQTVYIFGGYNPVIGDRGSTPDPLRDLYYQSLG